MPHFRDIAGFLLKTGTFHTTQFHAKFGDVPLGLDRRVKPKLIVRVITFELTARPLRPRYINVTDGISDRRTSYDSNTVLSRFILRASRGKK